MRGKRPEARKMNDQKVEKEIYEKSSFYNSFRGWYENNT